MVEPQSTLYTLNVFFPLSKFVTKPTTYHVVIFRVTLPRLEMCVQ